MQIVPFDKHLAETREVSAWFPAGSPMQLAGSMPATK